MEEKLVSVIIPTCDRHEYLNEAVLSVVNQTYSNLEIIIVDDNSEQPVNLSSVDLKDRKLTLIRNTEKKGGAYSRNVGARNSSGDYVAFLDDDDYYYEDKLTLLSKEINGFDAAFGKTIKMSDPDRAIKNNFYDATGHIKNLKGLHNLSTNSSLIKREVFMAIMFDENLQKFQDTLLHIYLMQKYKCKFIDEPVAFWRDNHALPQITDMGTQLQAEKNIRNYSYLRNRLIKEGVIGVGYRLYTWLKFIKMSTKLNKKPVESNFIEYLIILTLKSTLFR